MTHRKHSLDPKQEKAGAEKPSVPLAAPVGSAQSQSTAGIASPMVRAQDCLTTRNPQHSETVGSRSRTDCSVLRSLADTDI